MPIPFRCAGCGKEYRVNEKMAGKQATCRCGATTRVPWGVAGEGGTGEKDDSLDDWLPASFWDPVHPPPTPEPEPAAMANPEPPEPPMPPAIERAEPRRPCQEELARWRKLVGVASVAYGALAALVLLVIEVLSFPGGVVGWTADVVLAVAIAVGGMLILRHHPHGPACAGLACIFLCFFSAWDIFLRTLGALTVGQFDAVLLFVAFFVIAYSIPIGITVWCLRVETERQKREAEEQA